MRLFEEILEEYENIRFFFKSFIFNGDSNKDILFEF